MKKQKVIIYLITILALINNILISKETYISINVENMYILSKFMPIGNIYETLKIIIKYIIYFLFFRKI
jgi:hypothetical protein